MRLNPRIFVIVLAASIGLGITSSTAAGTGVQAVTPAGQAMSVKTAAPNVWRHCGWGTCTDYMTRSETARAWRALSTRRDLVDRVMNGTWIGISGLTTLASVVAGYAIGGPIGAAVAGAVTIVAQIGWYAVVQRLGSQFRTLRTAATTGGCYAISYARYGSNNPFFATGWRVVYESRWCKP